MDSFKDFLKYSEVEVFRRSGSIQKFLEVFRTGFKKDLHFFRIFKTFRRGFLKVRSLKSFNGLFFNESLRPSET